MRALLDEVAGRDDVETVLFQPVTAGPGPVDLGLDLVLFDRVTVAAELERSAAIPPFERTLLALGRDLEGRRQALDDADRGGALQVVWMSALVESEYRRAHAQDVLGELSTAVTLVGVDGRVGATAGDVSVARAALGMTDRAAARR